MALIEVEDGDMLSLKSLMALACNVIKVLALDVAIVASRCRASISSDDNNTLNVCKLSSAVLSEGTPPVRLYLVPVPSEAEFSEKRFGMKVLGSTGSLNDSSKYPSLKSSVVNDISSGGTVSLVTYVALKAFSPFTRGVAGFSSKSSVKSDE